ncbi:hypothetical protein HF521_006722 [Silurus meridionalis]|uniref:EF-hand domain-containing protein n=1 Tax=Silurus meridionalis TaxID=175797 RepID=A0A8T0ATD6_SILME|nr:hypothetical protein HF521_006722 [Silurus meridionalis]
MHLVYIAPVKSVRSSCAEQTQELRTSCGWSPARATRLDCALFLECDVDGSGVIEKGEFERMCSGLCVRSADIDDLFRKLDANQDGAINMEEFIRGFQTASSLSRGRAERRGGFHSGLGRLQEPARGTQQVYPAD